MTNQDTDDPQVHAHLADVMREIRDRGRGPVEPPIFYGANAQLARDMGVPIFRDGDTGEIVTKADYVQFGEHRIPIAFNPDMAEGELLIVGSCSCGHPATSHDNLGCNRRTGHCDICSCQVDVATLTTKIKEIGTEDTP